MMGGSVASMPSGERAYMRPFQGSMRNQPIGPLNKMFPARYQPLGRVVTDRLRG